MVKGPHLRRLLVTRVFKLVGEFVGPIESGENQYEPLALQIRCNGGDEFEAVCFRGGLPGQKGHRPEMLKLVGRRNGDMLVLSGGPWAVFVRKTNCVIVDSSGKTVGRLDRVVRQSPTLGAQPPEGAMVIFDGSNVEQFADAKMTKEGLLKEGALIKPMFQDFNFHAEFRIPYMPLAQGQQRGNSGFYLQSRYECQVLDSFALEPVFNGLGALYRQKKPLLNMAFPPLVWQTYDIQFTAPRWAADGTKIRNAQITSWVNGVKVQDNVALPNKTGAGQPEGPNLLPTLIQNHGDPVRFRNIWIVDRGLATGDFPVTNTPLKIKHSNDSNPLPPNPPEPKAPSKPSPPTQTSNITNPTKTNPTKTNPTKTNPTKTNPTKTNPTKTSQLKTESNKG